MGDYGSGNAGMQQEDLSAGARSTCCSDIGFRWISTGAAFFANCVLQAIAHDAPASAGQSLIAGELIKWFRECRLELFSRHFFMR